MARVIISEGRKERPGRCDICGESDGWYVRDPIRSKFGTPYSVVCECMCLDPPCSKCTAKMAVDGELCEDCATE